MSGRRSAVSWALALAVTSAVAGCGQADVSVLTYNVAGLPEGLSSSHPSKNSAQIGKLLHQQDVILLQENFAYHAELAAGATHPYQIPEARGEVAPFNASGLTRMSRLPPTSYLQRFWNDCHGLAAEGSDCLAPKGYSVAQHELWVESTKVAVHVYNIHMDSGEGPADQEARRAQVRQLLITIEARSKTAPVIVAGDTNAASASIGALVPLLEAGFRDACLELRCPEPNRVDRVLYRSSTVVTLEPTWWGIPDGFEDEDGNPLSDHEPVAVDFVVSVGPPSLRSSSHPDFRERSR